MPLFAQLQQDQLTARKNHDEARLSILQVAFSAVKNEKINRSRELEDSEVQAVLASQVKQLRDALTDFETAGRRDLIEKAKAEIAVLESYLPAQLSDEELTAIVQTALAEVGATSPADIGKTMGRVMGTVKGRADGNRVRALLTSLLEV